MVLFVIFISIVVALLTGSIARSKGRPQGLWTLLGACFGLIALGILAGLSDRQIQPWKP